MAGGVEQPPDRVVVQTGRLGPEEPTDQPVLQRPEVGEWDDGRHLDDKCPLAGPALDPPHVLEMSIGLEDRVRVDGQIGDDVLHPREPVTGEQITEAESLLDLMDDLEIGGDTRGAVETEADRGVATRVPGSSSLFIYLHS